MDATTYFNLVKAFTQSCREDKRLTPAAQLVYRVLLDEWNSHYWHDTFTTTDSDIIALTHLDGKTVTDAKRRLKSLGYIDFHGKPTTYSINSGLLDKFREHSGNDSGKPQKKCALLPPAPPNHSRRKGETTYTPTARACVKEEI